jgi:hypothetical protein
MEVGVIAVIPTGNSRPVTAREYECFTGNKHAKFWDLPDLDAEQSLRRVLESQRNRQLYFTAEEWHDIRGVLLKERGRECRELNDKLYHSLVQNGAHPGPLRDGDGLLATFTDRECRLLALCHEQAQGHDRFEWAEDPGGAREALLAGEALAGGLGYAR